jgi:hypothetical protein
MKITELREIIKEYNEEDLRLLIAELYKAMPKALREDKEIDDLGRPGCGCMCRKQQGYLKKH